MLKRFFGPSAAEQEAQAREHKLLERYRQEFTFCQDERLTLFIEEHRRNLVRIKQTIKLHDEIINNPTEEHLATLRAEDYTPNAN